MKKALYLLVILILNILLAFTAHADKSETHAHTYISSITTEPTCIKDGVITYTCECGNSYTETIHAKGHKWENWEFFSLPTCTEDGAKVRYCWECFGEEKEVVPATGHNFEKEVEPATTKADGKFFSRCTDCFTLEGGKEEIIPKIESIKLSTEVCTYNGKLRKPSVIVKDSNGKKLVEGTDFVRVYGGVDAGNTADMKNPGRYLIKIKFRGNYKGEYTLVFKIKPRKVSGLEAFEQYNNSIGLIWNQSAGATGYRIYQYSSSKGKYVKIDSIKVQNPDDETQIYHVKNLKSGTTYKFKIRPYTKAKNGETIWGDYSSVLTTATKTATPTLKVATASGSKATLSWNNVSGESGYQVYYSTSKNGKYKKMSNVSANKTNYTTEKLTAGKTYYFKIRTYKKVGDSTVYGDFSDIKSVKIPVIYYVTKSGKKYHVDGCRSLSKSKIQISYKNAVARGYKPCSSCIK